MKGCDDAGSPMQHKQGMYASPGPCRGLRAREAAANFVDADRTHVQQKSAHTHWAVWFLLRSVGRGHMQAQGRQRRVQ